MTDRLEEIERWLDPNGDSSEFALYQDAEFWLRWCIDEIKRLRGAVLEEREACAQVCDDLWEEFARDMTYGAPMQFAVASVQDRIRNRGKK